VSRLVYVYAIASVSSSEQPPIARGGIDREPVRWIAENALAAAVSDVPEHEFDERSLNAGIANMQWLAPRALAHQEVNQQLHEHSEALIPLAFGTVFRDDARVRAMLREQAASLAARLTRVRACSEWVVTVHRVGDPDTANTEQVRRLHEEIASAAPGRAHLLRKRLADVERDVARELERAASDRVVLALKESARDVYVEPLPNESLERPLLRASVLAARSSQAGFVQTVQALNTPWLRVALTGPWPAYRFAGLEQAHAAAAG
jgi:Gas vesicle synthesis protein GvpL/GvpF